MNWQEYVDLPTINDAWNTWNKFFRKKINTSIKFEKFIKSALIGQYVEKSISEFIKMNIENSGLSRIQSKSVNEAYKDKPRGVQDIKSVNISY